VEQKQAQGHVCPAPANEALALFQAPLASSLERSALMAFQFLALQKPALRRSGANRIESERMAMAISLADRSGGNASENDRRCD
jgi:hypothetical protein